MISAMTGSQFNEMGSRLPQITWKQHTRAVRQDHTHAGMHAISTTRLHKAADRRRICTNEATDSSGGGLKVADD